MEKDWLLRVRNLSVRFNSRKGTVHAVDDVSFDIAAGETLALVGETGCGKSVTARSILRLVPEPPGQYWSGQIGLRNADGSIVDILAASMDKVLEIRGERISMIFQDPGKALNPALQISRQLAEVFAQHRLQMIFADAGLDFSTATKLDKKFIMQRLNGVQSRAYALLRKARASALEKAMANAVEQALADTGIPNPKKVMISYPHQLSGGMKQRVMIAQALACDPDLLIADEPTTALDVTIQARILKLIREMQQKRGMAVLYITHDLSLVREFADRVAVMYAGRIVETGESLRVLESPRHPYTEGLLGAIPHRRTPRGELAAIPGSVPQLLNPPAQCHFASRCKWAAEACKQVIPTLLPIENGRLVSCLRFEEAAQSGIHEDLMPARAQL
jgi:oligopeptide/dipeptide ABC transporter ATP-binding protein